MEISCSKLIQNGLFAIPSYQVEVAVYDTVVRGTLVLCFVIRSKHLRFYKQSPRMVAWAWTRSVELGLASAEISGLVSPNLLCHHFAQINIYIPILCEKDIHKIDHT